MNGRIILGVLGLAALVSPLTGQSLEGQYRVIGSAVREAFNPVREVFQMSSAVMYFERKPFGFAAVMSPDGYLMTKASELKSRKGFTVRIEDKEYSDVVVVATNFDWDVALLKVEAERLIPVDWAKDLEIAHGTWVVSNGASSRTRRRVRPGIISANTRKIGGESQVVLGVVLKMEKDRIVVGDVADDSGAKAAGLKGGDVFLKAEGKEVKTREELIEMLKGKKPGDIFAVTILREEEELEIDITLTARQDVFEERKTRNDQMSGPVSKRRTNFERVLQHDTMLSERSVGGPLLDLDGRGVGLNIAYANRSESYAIPAADVLKLFGEMRKESGEDEEGS